MAQHDDRDDSRSIEDTVAATLQSIGTRQAGTPPAGNEGEVDPSADTSAAAGQPVDDPNANPDAQQPPGSALGRDPKGRFVKGAAMAPGADDQPAPAAEATPSTVPGAIKPKAAFVPKWEKPALEKWALLPPEVKSAVERREQDFHKGIEQYKNDAVAGRDWGQAIAPYAATIQSLGVSPPQAAQYLFATDHALRYGTQQQKWAIINKIAQDYGVVPPSQPESASQAQQPGQQQQPGGQAAPAQMPDLTQHPMVQGLLQRVAQLDGRLNQTLNAQQQAQQHELNTQISRFAGEPARAEYFETLKPTMAALLQSGQADSLETAYDLAFQIHPVTKSLYLAQQQDQWRKQATATAATARQAAAVNVARKGTVPGGQATGTMQDTLRSKARELGLIS